MDTATKLLTIDEFFALYDGRPYELVAGVPVPMYRDKTGKAYEVSPTGGQHQILVVELAHHLRQFVRENKLGIVLAGEGGFVLPQKPDTYRAFDVAFMPKHKIPSEGIPAEYWVVAPDLVVEVVSPPNRAGELRAKVAEYLDAGVRLVWLVYPDRVLVDVYCPDQPTVTLERGGTLDGGDVLPGFSLEIDTLFAPLDEFA